jgi:hypothetical protein
MANAQPDDLPVVESTAYPCRHLRNKGMYVYTDGDTDQAGDEDDHSVYWCLKSMTSYGPDDDPVGGRECRDSSRSCYESI